MQQRNDSQGAVISCSTLLKRERVGFNKRDHRRGRTAADFRHSLSLIIQLLFVFVFVFCLQKDFITLSLFCSDTLLLDSA